MKIEEARGEIVEKANKLVIKLVILLTATDQNLFTPHLYTGTSILTSDTGH